jgi:PAS domain S-box-containing protein
MLMASDHDEREPSPAADGVPSGGESWREQPLRAATDRAPVAVAILDRDLCYVYANTALAALYGRPIHDIVGRSLRDVLPPAEAMVVEATAREVLKASAPVSVSPPALASGVGRPARLTIATYYPAYDDAGSVVGVAATIFDATDRIIRHARERFLASATAVLAASLDYQTTIETLARRAVPFLADLCVVDLLEESETPGTPPTLRRVAAEHVDLEVAPVTRTLREHGAPALDGDHPVAHVVRTGEPLVIPSVDITRLEGAARDDVHLESVRVIHSRSAIIVPLVTRDRILGAISFVITRPGRRYGAGDLPLAEEFARRTAVAAENARLYESERRARAAAEQLRQTAETANIAKTQFLAAMSHELRTPLNAIAGYAELLQMGIRGPVTPEQAQDLARITRSQRHLLSVINDILNFARVDAGRVEYAMERVEVDPVVDEVRMLVSPQLTSKSLVLDVSRCDGVVNADAEKVRQILINLVANAIKFTPDGGRITIECEGGGGDGNGMIAVRVRDTGIGIPLERLESVFEPFVQLHRTLSQPAEGTGLGLAISRELARGMGGDLRAERSAGGASFVLTLPSDGSQLPP